MGGGQIPVCCSVWRKIPGRKGVNGLFNRTPVHEIPDSPTYTNNLERIETIRSDGKIDGADPTIAALTGAIEVRFADTALLDKATSGEPVALEFSYVISATEKLMIEAHEVYLPKPKRAISGPGGIQASFDWRAASNMVAGRMMSVTLTNDQEIY